MRLSQDQKDEIARRRAAGESVREIGLAMGLGKSTVGDHSHGDRYEAPPGMRLKGESALVDAEGNLIQKWVKTQAGLDPAFAKEAILEAFGPLKDGSAAFLLPTLSDYLPDLATIYPTADLHVGMLAWGRETGTPWNLDIAEATVLKAMNELVECAPRSALGIMLDLGDQTHINNQLNETPASHHHLDVDSRFPKVAKTTMRLRRALIELALQKHERVLYRGLPGNHDPEVAQMISIAMALFFENNPRVIVDDDPSDWWFYEHGAVMLCANHGHRVKPQELPGKMAAYRPDIWGRTKVRQAFSGHIHHTRAGEDNGARWETLRTVAPRDAYAHQHGYTAGRELLSITYHKARGLRQRQVVEIL